MEAYLSYKKAREVLGVCQKTLRRWEEQGLIETIITPGKTKRYNISKYLKDNNIKIEQPQKLKIAYVRVSSQGQKPDLERQKQYMKKNFPAHEIIEDIGSGINMNRRGLRKIIELAIENKISEVVVAHKDRLTRFGFDLIEDLIRKYSGGQVIILNKKKNMEPQEEIILDMMTLMNVFIAKMNGLRKYK